MTLRKRKIMAMCTELFSYPQTRRLTVCKGMDVNFRIILVGLFGLAMLGANQCDDRWRVSSGDNGKKAVVIIAPIIYPRDSGSMKIAIESGLGRHAGISVKMLIESPGTVKGFPFDLFEGPVEKSKDEYMLLQARRKKEVVKEIKCVPNGYYVAEGNGGFLFTTESSAVIKFLRSLEDGCTLTVRIQAQAGCFIEVDCCTDGLRAGLDEITPLSKDS